MHWRLKIYCEQSQKKFQKIQGKQSWAKRNSFFYTSGNYSYLPFALVFWQDRRKKRDNDFWLSDAQPYHGKNNQVTCVQPMRPLIIIISKGYWLSSLTWPGTCIAYDPLNCAVWFWPVIPAGALWTSGVTGRYTCHIYLFTFASSYSKRLHSHHLQKKSPT